MDQAMKKCIFLLLTMTMSSTMQAQMWCPPGATWTANFEDILDGVEGCESAVYMGDTLYEGRTAQRIAVEDIIMDYPSGSLDTTYWDNYTSVEDSIVYAWTDSEGWDTLYWFNTVPGDRWYGPGMVPDGMGFCGMMEVTDTTHAIINGHALRQVTCAYLDDAGAVTSNGFSFTERLGTGSMHFPDGGCFVVEAWWGGHTYQDDEFPLYDNGAGSNCDHFSSIAEPASRLRVSAFPTPGSDQLHITTGMISTVNVRVLDSMGLAVLVSSGQGGSLELNTAGFAPGFYLVEICTAEGRRTVKWMKR
jgi:hypothetical protein